MSRNSFVFFSLGPALIVSLPHFSTHCVSFVCLFAFQSLSHVYLLHVPTCFHSVLLFLPNNYFKLWSIGDGTRWDEMEFLKFQNNPIVVFFFVDFFYNLMNARKDLLAIYSVSNRIESFFSLFVSLTNDVLECEP